MKATIKRVIELGDNPRFNVYAGGNLIKCLQYKPGVPKDDPYNEEKNFEQAKELAKIIENSTGNGYRVEETVYETPETEQTNNQ